MTTLRVTVYECLLRVVEAYRLDRYDNINRIVLVNTTLVVEAYRLDRYDNFTDHFDTILGNRCRSLSFG